MSLSEPNHKQLIKAIKEDDIRTVESLLNLPDELLSEIQSDMALTIAVSNNAAQSCQYLVKYKTSPSQKARGLALINAAQNFGVTKSVSLNIVKILCEPDLHTPTQNDVSEALIAAVNLLKWDYINYLSSLTTENKPNQAAIELVFQKAIENAKWGLAKILCKLTDNAPNQKAVGDAIQKVVSSRIPLHLIKYFCEESTHKACSTDVDQALCALLACEEKTFPDKWAYIDYLITLTAENKPSQTVIDRTLKIMVKSNNIMMVKKLCSIETDNAPSQEARGVALTQPKLLDLLKQSRWISSVPYVN